MSKCITLQSQSLPPSLPSGMLPYLSDGIFPLLKSYYAAFFNPTVRTSDQDRKLQISSDILAALLVSCTGADPWGVKRVARSPTCSFDH